MIAKLRKKFSLSVMLLATIFLVYYCFYDTSDRMRRLKKISNYCTNESIKLNSFRSKDYIEIESHGLVRPSNVTIISMYFQLDKSKHSHSKYEQWLENFFLSVKSPLILFTDKKSLEKSLRARKYPTTLYITNSIWNVLREVGDERKRSYLENYNCVQLMLDPEYHRHNPHLYALWNLKSYIADKIAQENIYSSKAFIYTDAGAWRNAILENWPDENFVLDVQKQIGDKILFGQLYDEENLVEDKEFPDLDLIEGTFFMGSQVALKRFKNEFWNMHDEWLDAGKFIGKDQSMMNTLAFKNDFKRSVAKLNVWKKSCSLWTRLFKIDKWFFYQYFFATQDLYPCYDQKETLISP